MAAALSLGLPALQGRPTRPHGATFAPTSAASAPTDSPLIALHPNFYDSVAVPRAVAEHPPSEGGRARAIVVPHHLLAADLIARGFALAPTTVRTVYVVGPNHRNTGGAPLTTAVARWETPDGATVEADGERVAAVVSGLSAASLVEPFRDEHSIGAQVPFIRHYFPQARLVPLTLDSYATVRQAEQVGEWLAANTGPDDLVVFSIDFSHYLKEEEARRRDIVTRAAVAADDRAAISRFTNDNVDSPMSLLAALQYAKKANLKVNILANTTSNDFLYVKQPTVTTHFLMEFVR